MPSFLAASCTSGSNHTDACKPPGARCETPGGVLVATEMPRKRMFGAWNNSEPRFAVVA